MSRYSRLGKFGTKGAPSSIIDSVRVRPPAPAAKVLTQREKEHEAAAHGEPGYQTYEAFIADCRQHLSDPVGAGTGLRSHFTVYEDRGMVTSSGCYEKLFD